MLRREILKMSENNFVLIPERFRDVILHAGMKKNWQMFLDRLKNIWNNSTKKSSELTELDVKDLTDFK